MSLSD